MLGDISELEKIYIVCGYIDMRKRIDGLCALIINQLKCEPDKNSIYLFYRKRCDRIKVLLHEPDGYVLLYKRLEPGSNSTGLCPIWKLSSRKRLKLANIVDFW